ncbi:hypothetical protein AB0F17_28590 [Nonomuraea sp. NPDC026600]|uniref:hypothetical protein n=1 Tax=Nonomuraea sp. NPDC026600 TaxID=3155363 RepID=UPI0033C7DC7D
MSITPPPRDPYNDIDMPTAGERRRLGRTRPTRARELSNMAVSIMLALAAVIFHPALVALAPVLPPWIAWVLIAAFVGAASDVAASSYAGRPTRTASTLIVTVGGGVVIAAIAISFVP